MAKKSADLLPDTLDILVLKAVSLKPLHAYGVLLRIAQISKDVPGRACHRVRCIQHGTGSNTKG